jgi:hypothetical protein
MQQRPTGFREETRPATFVRAQLFYFMDEVEAVFGVWLIPLFVAIIMFQDGAADGCQGKKSAQLSPIAVRRDARPPANF